MIHWAWLIVAYVAGVASAIAAVRWIVDDDSIVERKKDQ
jgi:hypothetical protein